MNPFVQNIKLDVLKVVENYVVSIRKEGAAGAPKRMFTDSYLLEKQTKVSVYQHPSMTLLFKQLRPAGRDLFLYISMTLKKNKDYIELSRSKVCEDMGTSRVTFFNAIKQLTEAGIICKKGVTEHWINPMFLFHGDRIGYFRKLDPTDPEAYMNVVSTINPTPKES